MKFEKQIEDFIQMRIEGKSFDEIATILKTAKQTLIDWNKQLKVRDTINEGQALKISGLIKTYSFDLSNRLNTYLQLSKRINDELAERDLKEISTDLLLKMSISNDNRIKELVCKKIEIGSNPVCWEIGSDKDGFFNLQLDE